MTEVQTWLYCPESPSCLSEPAVHATELPNLSRPSTAGKDEGAIVAEILKQRLSPQELAQAASHAGSWLWYGYLAAGKTTLLTSQWKSGKTTLISVLLARMAKGGELAGLPVTAGRAAVITEEGPDNWDARCRKLQIGKHVSFFCRPFRAKPTMAQWRGLI